MEMEFKEKDCVQVRNNPKTPKMVISAIHPITKEADCYWQDSRSRKKETRKLPLAVLVHCPGPAKESLRKTKKNSRP
ncbi:MAG: hypothetical protein JST58_12570 [Bacteroidetes bacterium]|nr:hypothetical protein [Bacteroidota bacterium]